MRPFSFYTEKKRYFSCLCHLSPIFWNFFLKKFAFVPKHQVSAGVGAKRNEKTVKVLVQPYTDI